MKRIPERMCLGCREMKPKKELMRVVKSPASEITLDLGGKMPGRGAYVCRDTDCFNRVIKSKALSRAFKMQIPNETLEILEKETLKDNCENQLYRTTPPLRGTPPKEGN